MSSAQILVSVTNAVMFLLMLLYFIICLEASVVYPRSGEEFTDLFTDFSIKAEVQILEGLYNIFTKDWPGVAPPSPRGLVCQPSMKCIDTPPQGQVTSSPAL